jgi:hypothetical protein
MFKAEAEREHWLRTKAKGKKGFVKREILWSFLFWLILMAVIGAFGRWSVQETLVTSLIMLPIVLLGGYLSSGWKWKDLEKKYPE